MERSFIILSNDEGAHFNNYLMWIIEYPIDGIELIFVEMAAAAESVEDVRTSFAKYKKGLGKFKNITLDIIAKDTPMCYSEALNQGIAAAKSPIIFITNCRTMVFHDWYKWLDRHLEKDAYDIVVPLLNDSAPIQDIARVLDTVGASMSKLQHAVDYFSFVNGFFTFRISDTTYIETFAVYLKSDAVKELFPLLQDLESPEVTALALCKKAGTLGLRIGVAEDVFLFKALPGPERTEEEYLRAVTSDLQKLASALSSSGEVVTYEDLKTELHGAGVKVS